MRAADRLGHVVLLKLKGTTPGRLLPIFIGENECAALVSEIQKQPKVGKQNAARRAAAGRLTWRFATLLRWTRTPATPPHPQTPRLPSALIASTPTRPPVQSRPLTHDLFRDVIGALGHSLKEVRIVDLQEGTFYADLVFDSDVRVSARPSDSVAIALRMGVPIFVEEAVLDEAGLLIPDESDEESGGALREDEVEKFKEFLDTISPDDFKAT